MGLTTEKLKKILVEPGYISAKDFKEVEIEAKGKNKPVEDLLLDKGFIKDEELGQLIANDLGFPFVILSNEKIDESLFNMLPEVVAKSRQVIVFGRDQNEIKLGMVKPDDDDTLRILEKKFGQKIKPHLITKRDLAQAVFNYKPGLKTEYLNLLAEIDKDKKASRLSTAAAENNRLLITKIVDLFIRYGEYNHASDVHIEPGTNNIKIRFRIDGVLHNILEIPKDYYELILSRIKILSKMRIDEHFAPQDGKFRFKVDDKSIDIRVSIVPVTKGENVVMRILSAETRQMSLDSLGLTALDLKKVKQAMQYTAGMILVTGPTGSGKTTTIYEILKILNTEDVHISSIEDPVEYDIEGVSQIQVNPKANLTFASGLRAIVRQDPDIIMVGEIRDQETAQIAVNSAMTGHLVLSTLHANDSATTLPRLLDIGIEPFLIASTVKVIIAQRLVRMICNKCRASYVLKEEEKKMIIRWPEIFEFFKSQGKGDLAKVMLYKGTGCKVCANTGYSGRIGIFEILEVDQKIKELIVSKASSEEILQAAKSTGMTVMICDGIAKVANGVTTLEELLRVIQQ